MMSEISRVSVENAIRGKSGSGEGIGEFIDYRRRVVIRLSDDEFAAAKARGRKLREQRRMAMGLEED